MSFKTIIINCSYNIDVFFKQFNDIEGKAHCKIIDLTGAISPKMVKNEVLNPRTWDIQNKLELEALQNYANKVGELRHLFRHISIKTIPVYWLTSWAIKHPIEHWGATLFYLKKLLDDDNKFHSLLDKTSEVVVILPPSPSSIRRLVISWFYSKPFDSKLKVLSSSSGHLLRGIAILKAWLFFIFNYLQIKLLFVSKKENNERDSGSKNVLITKCTKIDEDIDLKDFTQVPSFEYDTLFIPTGLNYKKIKENSDTVPIQHTLTRAYPTFIQLNSLAVSILLKLFQVILISPIKQNKTDILLTKNIKQEIIIQLLDIKSLFLYVWLSNYFGQQKKTRNYIFTDEFYRGGRIISMAAKKSKAKTFGLQHGLIGRHHTVYHITDAEIDGKGGLPIPDYFIVWGQYFKNLFLSNNSLSKDYCLIMAHPKYLKYYPPKSKNRTVVIKRDKCKVLWCTTLVEPALFEFGFIRQLIEKKVASVEIRCHPLHPIYSSIVGKLSKTEHNIFKQITKNRNSPLSDAILSHNLIICSNPSTIFLDAIVFERPVIVIDSAKGISAIPRYPMEGVFEIRHKKEMLVTFEQATILDKQPNSKSINFFLHLDKQCWQNAFFTETSLY